ncbi:MAG: hypothetical protein DCO81_07535 [Candidatus Aquiluna sp. XM-24bin5]|nr:MAG: hypothetical protein DCO81_07535 [Candidatus Aquiluna sp. XM-24bin5]
MSRLDLRKLTYSPKENPFLESAPVVPIKAKSRYSATAVSRELMDSKTGEIIEAQSAIVTRHDVDDQHFVKVFADGVKAAYGLSRTAYRVFHKVLEVYEQTDMTGGYVDTVELAWFDGGLHGEDVGMSQQTFSRGLKELIEKEFLKPRLPNSYWVNPALFFKGDRVAFVKEYRCVRNSEDRKKLED